MTLGCVAAPACLQGGTVFDQQLGALQAAGLAQQEGPGAGAGDGAEGADGDMDGGETGGGKQGLPTNPTTTEPATPQTTTPQAPATPGALASPLAVRGRAQLAANSSGLGHHYGRPGVSFGARISGSTLTITLQRKIANYDVRIGRRIDGVVQPPVSMQGAGPVTLRIADNLSAGDHEIWWTHYGDAIHSGGVDQVVKLGQGDTFRPPPANPPRVIEVIGASAATGYGILPSTVGCDGMISEDPTLAWVERAASVLGAVPINSATAGMGVWWDYNYGHQNVASKMWPRIDPADAALKWTAPTQSRSDVVVIDLTGNDWRGSAFGLDLAANGSLYTQAMVDLMGQIWGVFPDAFIYLFINNGIDTLKRPALRTLFDTILAQARGAGHQRCRAIEAPWSAAGSQGCNEHPTVAAHQAMADVVVSELRRDFAW